MKTRIFLIGISLLIMTACGVKGDPLPPKQPPELGRGRPTYEKATEGLSYPPLPPVKNNSEDEEEGAKKEKFLGE